VIPAAGVLVLASVAAAAPGEPAVDQATLIAWALESAPTLEQARARARAAEARLALAEADRRPTLDLVERWSLSDNAPTAFMSLLNQGRFTEDALASVNDPPETGDWMTAVTLRYLLTDFGGRGARRRAALAELDREAALEASARRDVVHSVRQAWQELAEARARVRLWEATLELLATDERLTRARLEEGAALRSDLLSVAVRVGEARENLLSARHSAEIARVRLRTAVGRPLPPLALDPDALGRPLPPRDEEEAVAAALASHPRVVALAAAGQAADEAVGAARARRRPRLVAQAGWEWHGDSESFGLDRDSYLVAVALEVPLYDAGRARAATAEAVAHRDEVRAARRAVVLDLELAARTAHRRTVEALSRIDLAESAVESAAAAHAIVRERYGVGLTTVTDLLETERRLTEARVRAVEARAGAWMAWAALERVAGRSEP
jgi:outer membrane protein TolC